MGMGPKQQKRGAVPGRARCGVGSPLATTDSITLSSSLVETRTLEAYGLPGWDAYH
jgi:hypothetical protein